MTQRTYLARMESGEPYIGYAPHDSATLPPDGVRWLPRAPRPFERWDEDADGYVHDEQGEVEHVAGETHRLVARARKAVEAPLIMAGLEHPGMLLVREAAIRGISPLEMAHLVLSKAEPAAQLELDRQAASLNKSENENG